MRLGTPSLLVVWLLLLAGLFMMLPASSEGAPDKTAPEGSRPFYSVTAVDGAEPANESKPSPEATVR